MGLKSILADIGKDILKPFGWLKTHGPQLVADLDEAQAAVNEAALVATAAGLPAVAAAANKASGGMTLLEAAVTTETNATNLTAAAAGLTTLATGLEPVVGVKDPATVAAVATALGKVNAVATTLTNAAAAAIPPA
jgi:hypothetical protein